MGSTRIRDYLFFGVERMGGSSSKKKEKGVSEKEKIQKKEGKVR